jgi:hypothetical protein
MKIGRLRDVPRFVWGSLVIAVQARQSLGFLGGRLRVSGDGAFWTLTVWSSGREMISFRDSGFHSKVIPLAETWASEAVFGVWNSENNRFPGWKGAAERIAAHPNFTKELRWPSEAHLRREPPTSPLLGLGAPIPRPRRSRSLIQASPGSDAGTG